MKNTFLILFMKRGTPIGFLDAKECKRHKLANKLKVPEMKIGVKVEFEFK